MPTTTEDEFRRLERRCPKCGVSEGYKHKDWCPTLRAELAVNPITQLQEIADRVKKDNVNLPNHYARFAIEPIRFIGDNKLDWFQGNVVKYVVRHDAKNGIEDLKKARRYLDMYIEYLQGNEDWWKVGK